MNKKQLEVYLETRPLVKPEKHPIFDAYFKYSIQDEERFREFRKMAYAIKLMSNGASRSACEPMFGNNSSALSFACACLKEKEKEK